MTFGTFRKGAAVFQPQFRRCPARSSHTIVKDSEGVLAKSSLLRRGNTGKYLQSYNREVQDGRFSGSYNAWTLQRLGGNRVPGACAYISTLQLSKIIETEEYVNIRSRHYRPFMSREVLVDGKDVGRAELYFPPTSVPPGDLLRVYYDRDKGVLRFQTKEGEPLSEATDIDLVAKADQRGIRPLLLLAQAEGLIDKVPTGRLTALNFKTNINSGFYIRANIQKNGMYQPAISLPGVSRSFRFRLGLLDSPKPYIRFFPYIHQDGRLHLWDVERSADLDLKWGDQVSSWGPRQVEDRIPELFKFAQSLGYWKEF